MKIAVYTANIGGFDKVYKPLMASQQVDYVYFSDKTDVLAEARKKGWDDMRFVQKHTNDNRRESRRIHIQSYRWFAREYDVAIQHGANIQLAICPVKLVNEYLGGADGEWEIALFKHPHRDNVRDEVHVCATMGKDIPWRMWPQVKRYIDEGFPIDTFGLSACMLILWRHCQTVSDFQAAWWNEVRDGSSREQLSFDYIRWKKSGMLVNFIPGDPFNSPLIRYNRHE